MTDDRQLVRFAKWSPLGLAWVASLLGLLLIAILSCLLMKHRRHNRPPRLKVGLVYYPLIHLIHDPQHQATSLHNPSHLHAVSKGLSHNSTVTQTLSLPVC